MPKQPPENTEARPVESERPDRGNVFYANAFSFFYNEEQEAILDFRLVMPEDFQIAAGRKEEEGGEEVIKRTVSVNLNDVPIGIRVYMPMNQFKTMCQHLGGVWKKLQQTEKDQLGNDEGQAVRSEEA
jgi:hypothetical protein